jgi:hypothetical protein
MNTLLQTGGMWLLRITLQIFLLPFGLSAFYELGSRRVYVGDPRRVCCVVLCNLTTEHVPVTRRYMTGMPKNVPGTANARKGKGMYGCTGATADHVTGMDDSRICTGYTTLPYGHGQTCSRYIFGTGASRASRR